jgi:hypothetical protein
MSAVDPPKLIPSNSESWTPNLVPRAVFHPIDRIWALMKNKLNQKHREDMKKASLPSILKLLSRLRQNIPNSTFQKIVDELPDRINWVLKNGGETAPSRLPKSWKRGRVD